MIAALVVWSGRCGGGEPQRRFDDPPGTAAQQPAVQPAIAESAQQRAVLPPAAGHQQVVAGLDAALGGAAAAGRGVPVGHKDAGKAPFAAGDGCAEGGTVCRMDAVYRIVAGICVCKSTNFSSFCQIFC